MKNGDRVKYSRKAFEHGVCERSDAMQARRGTAGHEVRSYPPNIWTVKWDDRKTPQNIHRSFLTIVKQ